MAALKEPFNLNDQLKHFQEAVEGSCDHTVITDANGLVIYANLAATKTTGFSVAEIIGTKAGKLWGGLMPKSFYKKLWHTVKDKKQTFESEIRNKRKSDEVYLSRLKIIPISPDSGPAQYFVAIEKDLTSSCAQDGTQTDIEIGFIKFISSDCLSDLNKMLDQRYGEISAKQKEKIKKIKSNILRIRKIVYDHECK